MHNNDGSWPCTQCTIKDNEILDLKRQNALLLEHYNKTAPKENAPPNLAGLWKLRNGYYLRMSSYDENDRNWGGYLIQDDGKEIAFVRYDRFGNEVNGDRNLDLLERKRGEEKGWPL